MEFKTRISKIEHDDITIRSTTLSQLVQNGSFPNAIFLVLSGRNPTTSESILFEKMLVSIIDHGMGTTSSLTSRFVASGGNALNVAVGGGVLALGDFHGGAIEKAMEQFYLWKKKDHLREYLQEQIRTKQVLYGFGHRIYKDQDPRVVIILEELQKLHHISSYVPLKELVETVFEEEKGKKIPLNIDGLMALLLCDFGFDPLVGKGIFIIGRTPGLVAQAYEELRYEKPVRRVEEEDIVFVKDESQHDETERKH